MHNKQQILMIILSPYEGIRIQQSHVSDEKHSLAARKDIRKQRYILSDEHLTNQNRSPKAKTGQPL